MFTDTYGRALEAQEERKKMLRELSMEEKINMLFWEYLCKVPDWQILDFNKEKK